MRQPYAFSLRVLLGIIAICGVGCGGLHDRAVPADADARATPDAALLTESEASTPTRTCPPSVPSVGGACEAVGIRCTYGDSLVSYLCAASNQWQREAYAPERDAGPPQLADGSSTEAAPESKDAASEAHPAVATAACESFSMATCPMESCRVACCPGGGESDHGCSGCCTPKMCQEFDAERCPSDRCVVMPGCTGAPVCRSALLGAPPACGGVGFYGIACCEGLHSRCGKVVAGGSCDADAGGYDGVPQCLACGDGTCEAPLENRCNCPEDCTE